MRILLCAGITCSSTHKTVNLHVELVSDAIGHFAEDGNNPSGAPNNQSGIYSESDKNTALKFGLRFTTEQHH
jgi:hypothetical protein